MTSTDSHPLDSATPEPAYPEPANPAPLPPHTPRTQLPDFTPVPRKSIRKGGWSPQRQREFINRLAETGSVRAATRAMGVTDSSVYMLRRHPDAASFRDAWEAALDLGIQRIEDVAMDRAMNGVEVPVYHRGELVGTRRVYNDRLLMFLLRSRAPDRFRTGATPRPNAVGKMELKRLKKKWRARFRKEWEEEAYGEDDQEVRDSIDKLILKFRAEAQAKHARLSPQTLAAHAEYERLMARDEATNYDCTTDPEHELYEPPMGAPAATGDDDQARLPPPGWDRDRAKEPEREKGPRVRTVKDDGW